MYIEILVRYLYISITHIISISHLFLVLFLIYFLSLAPTPIFLPLLSLSLSLYIYIYIYIFFVSVSPSLLIIFIVQLTPRHAVSISDEEGFEFSIAGIYITLFYKSLTYNLCSNFFYFTSLHLNYSLRLQSSPNHLVVSLSSILLARNTLHTTKKSLSSGSPG